MVRRGGDVPQALDQHGRRRRSRASRSGIHSGRRAGGGANRQGAAEARAWFDGPRGRRRPHAKDRPLLPGRHGGRVRHLARVAGARRHRPADLLERPGDGRRQGPGRRGVALLPVVSARRRRQSHQQAQRLAGAQRAVCPADSAGRGRRRALPRADPEGRPRPDHVHREAELPEVRALLHAVRLRRASPKPGQDAALVGKAFNSLEYSFDPANIPKNVSGQIKDRIPDLPITVLAEATADGSAERRQDADGVDAGRAESRSRALERLGHRPAAAGRSEGRRVRVQAGDGGRARIRRRLDQRGARAHPGRRDRRRQAVYRRAGAEGRPRARSHLLLQGADPEGRRRLRRAQ